MARADRELAQFPTGLASMAPAGGSFTEDLWGAKGSSPVGHYPLREPVQRSGWEVVLLCRFASGLSWQHPVVGRANRTEADLAASCEAFRHLNDVTMTSELV